MVEICRSIIMKINHKLLHIYTLYCHCNQHQTIFILIICVSWRFLVNWELLRVAKVGIQDINVFLIELIFFWTSYCDIKSYFKSAVKNPLESLCGFTLRYTEKMGSKHGIGIVRWVWEEESGKQVEKNQWLENQKCHQKMNY